MNSYERDYAAWALEQAHLLRSGALEKLDVVHVAEELEAIMGNNRRELYGRLRMLIGHLLMWTYQPEQRSAGWIGAIKVQRKDIRRLLRESPSLTRFLDEECREAYADAVEMASLETGLPDVRFPESCPFPTDALLDADFWPA